LLFVQGVPYGQLVAWVDLRPSFPTSASERPVDGVVIKIRAP
jgi:hypothetical protein